MNIIEKLKLQQELGGLVLFKEGLFLRAYNESSYILTKLLGQPLKITCYQVKQYDKLWLAMTAFPCVQLSQRLPNVKIKTFGGHLAGDFDMTPYQFWFADLCRHANNVGKAVETRKKGATANFTRVSAGENLTTSTVELDAQQTAYLNNWQKNEYPPEVDQAFIASLKTKLQIR